MPETAVQIVSPAARRAGLIFFHSRADAQIVGHRQSGEEVQMSNSVLSIAALNDRFRKQPHTYGRLMLTVGVKARGDAFVAQALRGIACYESFPHGDDPYGEHDFGAFVIDRQRIFWKIDYYDLTMTHGSADPSDNAKTLRVLTVILADEY